MYLAASKEEVEQRKIAQMLAMDFMEPARTKSISSAAFIFEKDSPLQFCYNFQKPYQVKYAIRIRYYT